MTTETSVFQTAIELPTLSDTGILAIAMGKRYAVDAIARRLQAQTKEKPNDQ